MNTEYSEDVLIEQPAIALFSEVGWQTANCFYEKFGANGTLGRETTNEVVLLPRLLDIIENFTLFSEASGGIVKLVAKNHQYLGVNNATEALKQIEKNRGASGSSGIRRAAGKATPWSSSHRKCCEKSRVILRSLS